MHCKIQIILLIILTRINNININEKKKVLQNILFYFSFVFLDFIQRK